MEFTDKNICTASRQYQHLKLKELDEEGLSPAQHQSRFDKIVNKSCICVGLSTPALLTHNLNIKVEGPGVSVCPGPNIAYFSKMMGLKDIVDHIYGRANMISRTDRPNLFVKELTLYIDFLKNKITKAKASMTDKQEKYFLTFVKNLNEGINYYDRLFTEIKGVFAETKSKILSDLEASKKSLHLLKCEIENLLLAETTSQ